MLRVCLWLGVGFEPSTSHQSHNSFTRLPYLEILLHAERRGMRARSARVLRASLTAVEVIRLAVMIVAPGGSETVRCV